MTEKTVVFLEINSSYSHSLLSEAILHARAAVKFPQWQWKKVSGLVATPTEEMVQALEEIDPELILSSVYLFNHTAVLAILEAYQVRHPEVRIVLGGPEFLGDNREFLATHPGMEAVRGEEAALDEILADQPPRAERLSETLDEIPSPYRMNMIPSDRPFYQLETSRGCDSNCIFCTSCRDISGGGRYYSLERVVQDLDALSAAHYKEIRLLDRTFNMPPERAAKLLQLFRERYSNMRFHLEIDPGRLKNSVLEELKKAPDGQLHVEAGIQSLDVGVLRKIRRAATAENMLNGLRQLIAIGKFEVHCDLIAGLPGQTFASLEKDIMTLIAANPAEIQLEVLKILPGTPLEKNLPAGMQVDSSLPRAVIATAHMTAAEIFEAVRWSVFLESFYNRPELRVVLRLAELQQPGWIRGFFCQIRDQLNPQGGKLSLDRRYALLLQSNCPTAARQAAMLQALLGNVHLPEFLPQTTKKLPEYDSCPVIWRRQKSEIKRLIVYQGLYFGCSYGRRITEIRLPINAEKESG